MSLSKMYALVCVVLLCCSACEFGVSGVVVGPNISDWDTVALTSDAHADGSRDRYIVDGDVGRLTVSAPAGNVGGNTRIAVAPSGVGGAARGSVCVTYSSETQGRAQEGVLLGWDTVAGRGVTLTKNIWGGAYDVVNLHQWKARADGSGAAEFTLIASWTVPWLGGGGGLPYRFCGRRDGRWVEFVVGPDDGSAPIWWNGSTERSGSAWVDSEYVGLFGVYAGHLEPGNWVEYRNLAVVIGDEA